MTKFEFSKCSIVFLCLSGFSALLSIAMLAGGYNAMFDAILKSQLKVTEGSYAYDIWKDFPVPVIFRTYFFSITNPDDYLKGAKPILKEMGPYSYRQYEVKENIKFHDNKTVTYYIRRWWVWDEKLSMGNKESDIVTIINPVPVTAAYTVRNKLTLLTGLNTFLKRSGEVPVLNVTAGDLLFYGFEDVILNLFQKALDTGIFENSSFPLDSELLTYDKFAWFYNRNDSMYYDGILNMYTGETSLDDVGRIDWWNYTHYTDFYDFPCNGVKGSAGELFPPDQTKTSLVFYSTDLCSTVRLDYHEEMEDRFGNKAYKFWGSKDTFLNQTVDPLNECFCIKGRCAPSGLINTESCRYGTPSFISFPHFFNADPYLLDEVIGLLPKEEKHAFYIGLQPELGTPLEVAARMQINMQTMAFPGLPGPGHIGRIDMFKDIRDVILPLFWFEMLGGLDQELSDDMQPAIFIAATPTMYILFGLMLVIAVVVIVTVLCCSKKKVD